MCSSSSELFFTSVPKKKGNPGGTLIFAWPSSSLTARLFYTCGLAFVRGERTGLLFDGLSAENASSLSPRLLKIRRPHGMQYHAGFRLMPL
ncbi:hypothetical protein SAMN04488040_1884 [Sulfitobacter marinus]|uniref:Uncharacterized protein n=1 Tax=Sulfitobacter marinus TaxID=394264 RepID=A0A1I6SFE0_9RHOB|nr:hypothetical protein SAMN04488040_1884 [Sulfitobacter marinus]